MANNTLELRPLPPAVPKPAADTHSAPVPPLDVDKSPAKVKGVTDVVDTASPLVVPRPPGKRSRAVDDVGGASDSARILTGRATSVRPRFVGKVELVGGRAVVRDLLAKEPAVRVPLCDGAATPARGTIVEVTVKDVGGRQVATVVGAPIALRDTAAAAVHAIAVANGLDPTFPPAVMAEVAAIRRSPGIDDPSLKDLTHLPFVTIDNDGSRDLDQAMYICRRADGGYDVSYALADASHFVKPGTALFAEALRRGASYYLPGLSVPMLPRELSEGLISLNEGQDRRALVMKMSLDKEGGVTGATLTRARIRSQKKLTYNGVQRYYDGPVGSPCAGQAYTETLDLLATVGKLRIAAAKERDVIAFQRRDVRVDLEHGETHFSLLDDARNDVEKYNEQISLLCNILGALFLKGDGGKNLGLKNVQAIFRGHEAPPAARLGELQGLVNRMVELHHLDPELWGWHRERRESLAAYLDRLHHEAPDLRLVRVIERQAMMCNVGARFGEEPAPHFGIGAEAYARFSSPMREMVGIFTHKEAIELLEGRGHETPVFDDDELRRQIIDAGNRAHKKQSAITRQANLIAIDDLLAMDASIPFAARPLRRGTILGAKAGKIYVQLDEPPIEVKLYPEELASRLGCQLTADASGLAFATVDGKTLAVGQQIDLRTAMYDERADRWLLEPVW
ncbi:MAG: RNB domain-containing ribonuclease [Deltaproteobacteria bacterium]|nr:RNB domain-containing ribonuclease [Deltaproteobacteria bacterium]